MAIFLALFSAALWGSADFEGGRLAKRRPAIAVTGISQSLGLIFGILVVTLTGQWRGGAFGSTGYLWPAVLAGVSGYLGLVALYAGLATGKMGVVSPISALCAIIPLTFGLLTGEHISFLQACGIGMALVGAFCASGPELSPGLSIRPLVLAVIAAIGFGTALTFMAKGSESSAPMTMIFMRVTTLAISGAIALRFRNLGGVTRREIPRLAFIGAADFSANVIVGIASTRGLVSIVMVLGSLFPIMTAVLAFKILHERLHVVQYVGIILALTGIAFVSIS
jgi:drug/metabolite transporter (DMT)-like permease